MNSSRSTLQNPSSLWSLAGQAPDQHSTRLQCCLQRLDGLGQRMPKEIQEIEEIHSLIMDILNNNHWSDATIENLGRYDSTIDCQAGLYGLDAISTPFVVSSHNRYLVSQPALHGTFGVPGSLSESTGLLSHSAPSLADYATQAQHSIYSEAFLFYDPRVTESSLADVDTPIELSLRGTSDTAYEHDVQSFQGIHSKEHVTLNSSGRPNAQQSIPVVQASQAKGKIKCIRSGCTTLLTKGSLNRHVREVHEGKIRAVCEGCRKPFKRPYRKGVLDSCSSPSVGLTVSQTDGCRTGPTVAGPSVVLHLSSNKLGSHNLEYTPKDYVFACWTPTARPVD
ncbi:uncharacterized protein F5147DRAFT_653049 [Suillus discolor]|uniref:Uncharacterized protein n=1 Tax=Suillus discolor TaxID=1912936 RepID=A0A9P7F691_9AGAM|nr:uncharacterized protein F5147DRAFT_653049 [Suillus discolor]KAG2107949.1 hypothetical protein F5147DRAFT_653049 [Suillus discolor]